MRKEEEEERGKVGKWESGETFELNPPTKWFGRDVGLGVNVGEGNAGTWPQETDFRRGMGR